MPDDKPAFNLDDIDFGQTIRGHQKDDSVFDRFVLKKLLGRGGMGVVWLALDERLGRDVALKFAPEAIRYDEIAVEELKEETRKGLNLAHPNIVKIYDFLLDEDYAAISMEFIDGENLGMLRTKQPNRIFEPRQITAWTGQLLDALDYAHRGAKVIHRDLKPANLMLDRAGHLRVTDFGIARSISEAMDRATLGKASTGTLAYMSPQQANGKTPHVSDDIYAFGSTLYELLTGKPPFHSGNIAQQLKDEPVTPLTERRKQFNITSTEPIPPEWERTILACLEKAAENRPPSALAVMERLGLTAQVRANTEPPPAVIPATPAPPAGYNAAPATSAHVNQPATYVRPGGGLMEITAPGHPLTAAYGQAGGPATHFQTPATTRHYSTTPPPLPRKKGHPVLWSLLTIFLLFVVAATVGIWWGWDHGLKDQYASAMAMLKGKRDHTIPPLVTRHNLSSDSNSTTSTDKTGQPTGDPGISSANLDVPSKTSANPSSLQGMMDLAKAGDTVKVPAGVYGETLQFKEGVNLIADGVVVVQTDGKSGPVLKVESCNSGSITGFTFQHSGELPGGSNPSPVASVKTSSVKLQDCKFKRSIGAGAIISGKGSSTLTNCTFTQSALSGVIVERGATATLSHCDVHGSSGGSGIEVRSTGSRANLIANTCTDNTGSGIVVKEGASASISGDTKCSKNKEAGIAVIGEESEITVDSGMYENNRDGVMVMDRAVAHLKGLTVHGSTGMGMEMNLPASGTEITDCTVADSAIMGMLLFGDKNSGATLTGNHVRSSGHSGIALQGPGFRPVLDHNTSTENGNVGIYVSEGSSGELRNNDVRGNKNAGLAFNGAAPDVKKENNITK